MILRNEIYSNSPNEGCFMDYLIKLYHLQVLLASSIDSGQSNSVNYKVNKRGDTSVFTNTVSVFVSRKLNKTAKFSTIFTVPVDILIGYLKNISQLLLSLGQMVSYTFLDCKKKATLNAVRTVTAHANLHYQAGMLPMKRRLSVS
jgi:hypothetical protein